MKLIELTRIAPHRVADGSIFLKQHAQSVFNTV